MKPVAALVSIALVILAGCRSDVTVREPSGRSVVEPVSGGSGEGNGGPVTGTGGRGGSGKGGGSGQERRVLFPGAERVPSREWSSEGTEDIDDVVTYGCFVPSVPSGNGFMDLMTSKDGRCLVWYIHVWAERSFVRRAHYRVIERSGNGDVRQFDVFDPVAFDPVAFDLASGVAVDRGRVEATVDELHGETPVERGVGLQVEPISLADFPLRVEWSIVEIVPGAADGSPAGKDSDGSIALSGEATVSQDFPVPPAGQLSQPSLRLQLCEAELKVLQAKFRGGASAFALQLRVGPAPTSQPPPGARSGPRRVVETRVPITEKRVADCLRPGGS